MDKQRVQKNYDVSFTASEGPVTLVSSNKPLAVSAMGHLTVTQPILRNTVADLHQGGQGWLRGVFFLHVNIRIWTCDIYTYTNGKLSIQTLFKGIVHPKMIILLLNCIDATEMFPGVVETPLKQASESEYFLCTKKTKIATLIKNSSSPNHVFRHYQEYLCTQTTHVRDAADVEHACTKPCLHECTRMRHYTLYNGA